MGEIRPKLASSSHLEAIVEPGCRHLAISVPVLAIILPSWAVLEPSWTAPGPPGGGVTHFGTVWDTLALDSP